MGIAASEDPAPDISIDVLPGGPLIMHGGVELREGRIRQVGKGYVLDEGREFPTSERYALCRCGHSHTTPFCDGTHAAIGFDGRDAAPHTPYADRADVYEGPVIDLGDDHRCAFVRFCHNEGGDAWTQANNARSDTEITSATAAIDGCLAGRITRRNKQGEWEEPTLEPRVTIIQDPDRNASAGIAVQGGIPLTGTDAPYEARQRYMLCRCGESSEMPFCDATHVSIHFDDGHLHNTELHHN